MNQPRDFSLHGAIDLGARQAAAQRRQRAAEQGPAAASQAGTVIDVTDESFNTDVVARSQTVPVVLDLWAEWCGPCKQLGPVLEKLAAEANGAWILARVDVDANPQLSAALQVQSIPMVVAVVAGQIADGFLGAMPEAQVREWLGQVMRVAEQLGLQPAADDQAAAAAAGQPDAAGQAGAADQADAAGQQDTGGPQGQADGRASAQGVRPEWAGTAGTAEAESAFAAAQAAMERGDMNAAEAEFEKVLSMFPGDPVATMGVRQVSLIRRVESYDQVAARRDAEEHPDDASAQLRVADIELAMGKIEASFDRLLDTIRRTKGEDREIARKHLVSLFEIFPPRDPRVAKARSQLSSLLF
jgi:putative thioredoxin